MSRCGQGHWSAYYRATGSNLRMVRPQKVISVHFRFRKTFESLSPASVCIGTIMQKASMVLLAYRYINIYHNEPARVLDWGIVESGRCIRTH